ncbi:MAG: outer membrane protein assembly factor BamA [Coraliomargaritaceae bacterium]
MISLHRLSLFYAVLLFSLSFGIVEAEEVSSRVPKIAAIEVEFDSFQPVSDEYVSGFIQLREGMELDTALLDQSIRALYGSGYFENVKIDVEEASGGAVILRVLLDPKYTIGQIIFEGNEGLSDRRLSDKSELETRISLDEFEVKEAADRLVEYYVEKGYADAEVDYRIERDRATGYATVVFDIEEAGKVRITKIEFEGNTAFKDDRLRKVLKTKKNNWLSWITGDGKFDEVKFKEDLNLLQIFYSNNGYLDVDIDDSAVAIDFIGKKKIRISIPVFEGQQYFVGKMSVENATIFTEDELLSFLTLQPGDVFSPEAVDAAASSVGEYFTSRGYLETRVRAERVSNLETREIDLVFRVRESSKFYVESIEVEGNTKSKSKVIMRELALRPGDVFDMTKMEVSESRLNNTRFFDEVRLNPEMTNIPGRRDLGITVQEARTGSLSFGAGFGSVESIVVYAEMRQGNFDILNWRNGFQGDGQKFRIRGSLGSSSNQILISFEEPWLFEQRLAFGVELFRTESDYNSSDYDELRTGFELYLRRRLFELVEARASYRLEEVEIIDVSRDNSKPREDDGSTKDDGVADVFQAAEGSELVSKGGLTFLRDTRDSLLFTRKGNRTTLSHEWAGLGGDVDYFKFEGRTAQFIPTFDLYEQSLSIIGRLGTIIPYGESEITPFYDRFYLGGPDTLRGYDHRDIGPRDNDDPNESVGGNSYGLLSLEYTFRLAEPLGLAVFYDAGFINEEENDFDVSNYADNWGVGARLLMLGSPLKLDLGFPITTPKEVEGSSSQFHFSFGTRF